MQYQSFVLGQSNKMTIESGEELRLEFDETSDGKDRFISALTVFILDTLRAAKAEAVFSGAYEESSDSDFYRIFWVGPARCEFYIRESRNDDSRVVCTESYGGEHVITFNGISKGTAREIAREIFEYRLNDACYTGDGWKITLNREVDNGVHEKLLVARHTAGKMTDYTPVA